jgi:hypothetical protein
MVKMRPDVLVPHRGRTLSVDPGRTLGDRVPNRKACRRHLIRVAALIGVLPMFAQCFQYMTDIPPLYLLSKVWPFLMLPIAGWALMRLDLPNKALHIAVLCWLLVITPLIGILQLGNNFDDAMATTVKVWPLTYVFALSGVLVLLRPPYETVHRVIIGFGIATFVTMSALWVTVPESAYGGGDLDTKLFMIDMERGFRIYMPMYFGVMLILYLNRSAWVRFAWWKLIGIVTGLALMLMIYKQRAAIASAVLAVVLGSVLSLKRWRIAGFTALGIGVCAGVVLFLARAQNTAELTTNLGSSLAVREVSVSTAWDYLSTDPVRWILGVGGTTRLGDVTLGRLFNNPMFFLADIGWLGVLFEYGAIGVLLMLLVYGTGLRSALAWAHPDDPLSQAFADYIIYLLSSSIVYSAVFTPGELTTTMALSYYLSRARRAPSADQ